MLELAIFFLVVSSVTRAFGSAYADVANTTLTLAGMFALAWLVVGVLTLALQRPLERRLSHHHA